MVERNCMGVDSSGKPVWLGTTILVEGVWGGEN